MIAINIEDSSKYINSKLKKGSVVNIYFIPNDNTEHQSGVENVDNNVEILDISDKNGNSITNSKDILEIDSREISIPLGTILGISALSGKGPKIKTTVTLASNVTSTINNSFTSTGINQTMHEIYVNVNGREVKQADLIKVMTTDVLKPGYHKINIDEVELIVLHLE